MGKIYAVRKGRKPGLYHSWEDCKAQVHGYSGAEYKSFGDEKSAADYLQEGRSVERESFNAKEDADNHLLKDSHETRCNSDDEYKAYVDGSYDGSTNRFSYGAVMVKDGKVVAKTSGNSKDIQSFFGMSVLSMSAMRNVSGEICAAVVAIQYCIEREIPSVTIYHDYEGVGKWADDEWKANNVYTRVYKNYVKGARVNCDVKFCKVKAHSNNKYNDMADALAKSALGISAA